MIQIVHNNKKTCSISDCQHDKISFDKPNAFQLLCSQLRKKTNKTDL